MQLRFCIRVGTPRSVCSSKNRIVQLGNCGGSVSCFTTAILKGDSMDGKTNFDRLKEMSAEDFAVWIGTVAEGCDFCPHHNDCLYDDKYSDQCEALWLRWLNSPAEV